MFFSVNDLKRVLLSFILPSMTWYWGSLSWGPFAEGLRGPFRPSEGGRDLGRSKKKEIRRKRPMKKDPARRNHFLLFLWASDRHLNRSLFNSKFILNS
jgi:hypothetical protein